MIGFDAAVSKVVATQAQEATRERA